MAFHDLVLSLDGRGGWELERGQRARHSKSASGKPSLNCLEHCHVSHDNLLSEQLGAQPHLWWLLHAPGRCQSWQSVVP